jgi:predicted DNA-binding transcriptional regulator AlpA
MAKAIHEAAPVYISITATCARYGGKSRVTVWRWIKAGILPKPHYFGPTPMMKVSELDAADAARAVAAAAE